MPVKLTNYNRWQKRQGNLMRTLTLTQYDTPVENPGYAPAISLVLSLRVTYPDFSYQVTKIVDQYLDNLLNSIHSELIQFGDSVISITD